MRSTGLVVVFLMLAAAIAAAACGHGGDAQRTPPASPSPGASSPSAADTWRTRSELQTELLRSFIYSAQAWSYEPRGDVRPSSDVSTTLVFAKVTALPDDGRRVRFDCCQFYVGNAARSAARQDGVDPATMNAPTHVRNQFAHVQELPAAAHCPVVTTGNGVHVQNGFGGAAHARLYYWLIIGEDGRVHGALWQATY